MDSRTLSVYIDLPWKVLYEKIWQPEIFAEWAAGLSKARLHAEGNTWKAEGPSGPVTIRFTDHNDLGILDHYVDPETGPTVYVPLRVIANGNGAEVQLTLFRQPGMTDETYAGDAAMVESDLRALRQFVMEGKVRRSS